MGKNGVLGSKLEPFCFEKKKMCFGTVLDHLDAILVHFEQNLNIEKKIDFLTILGPFWGTVAVLASHWADDAVFGDLKTSI